MFIVKFLKGFISQIISDKCYLKIVYQKNRGEKLHLSNPLTFQEKLQWLKLYNRNPLYSLFVDKYEVKKYVTRVLGEKYVIPTLGCWNNAKNIDFNLLPNKFVLKTTHDSGGVIICNDKSRFDCLKSIEFLNNRINNKVFYSTREWPYENVKPRIIAEEYIERKNNTDLVDYKIYCFYGIPKYIQVIQNRFANETIDFFDTEWNHQEFTGLSMKGMKSKKSKKVIEKPINLNEMLIIAEKLSVNIPFVRIDLYNIEGNILFGEMTFFPLSGLGFFTPSIWDKKLGDCLSFCENIHNIDCNIYLRRGGVIKRDCKLLAA